MDRGLCLSCVYFDNDIEEIKATAWNGSFGGEALVYVSRGGLQAFAEGITEFPTSQTDVRDLSYGTFTSDFAGGGLRFILRCYDLAGHTQLELRLAADERRGAGRQQVTMVTAIEPVSIDRFVEELKQLSASLSGSASLRF